MILWKNRFIIYNTDDECYSVIELKYRPSSRDETYQMRFRRLIHIISC